MDVPENHELALDASRGCGNVADWVCRTANSAQASEGALRSLPESASGPLKFGGPLYARPLPQRNGRQGLAVSDLPPTLEVIVKAGGSAAFRSTENARDTRVMWLRTDRGSITRVLRFTRSAQCGIFRLREYQKPKSDFRCEPVRLFHRIPE